MKPHIVGMIFARGGSKGVPKKNIRLLGGKPLIAHAIQTAKSSTLIDRVIVSTDNHEIANIAAAYGAEIPFMRPPELARDDSPELMAWRHAIEMVDAAAIGKKIDVFVCIPPTSPFRSVDDVDSCIKTLLESDADIVVTVKASDRNPYFNMVTIDDSGCAQLVMKAPKPFHRRQDAPAIYDVTTVAYAARPEYVLQANSLFSGRTKAVVVPAERALDIDTEIDFVMAELMHSRLSAH